MQRQYYIALVTPYKGTEHAEAAKRAEDLTKETGYQFIVLAVDIHEGDERETLEK